MHIVRDWLKDLTLFGEDCGRAWELRVRGAMECGELGKTICGSLGGKSLESRENDGGLACGVSEGSKDSTELFELRLCGPGFS